MSAQGKEAVLHTDFFHIQDLTKDCADDFFCLVSRCYILVLCLCFDVRKCLSIQFSALINRNTVDLHQIRRDHIVRQVLSEFISYHRRTDFFISDNIGIDFFVAARICSHDYGAVFHYIDFTDPALDFSKLDSETTDLHLVVNTSKIFDVSVRQPARQVSRMVHSSFSIRILHKLLSCQFRSVQVSSGQTISADAQFSRHTDSAQGILTYDIDLCICDRLTYRDILVILIDSQAAGPDCCLRRTVYIFNDCL